MNHAPAPDFSALIENAILIPSQNGREAERAVNHMRLYVTALALVRTIARPDMRVIDIASFGTILPALRRVLGFRDVTVTGIPLLGQKAHEELSLPPTPDGDVLTCPYDRFDIEGPFPYADGSFDLVILTEVLEHISRDPMHTVGEINRITKVGGWFLLSTPNCCSLGSVAKTLRGRHPYVWCPYNKGGHRDRHNREYTPDEVRGLLESANYKVAELITRDGCYGAAQPLGRRGLKLLANWAVALISFAAGRYVSPALRGESIFALARKDGPVKTRFPEFLYY